MTIRPTEIGALPGGDLVARGLDDLSAGLESEESLLVSIGGHRLRRAGFDVPTGIASPERRLYARLVEEKGAGAHSAYNALIRRLVSFERAVECAN